MRAVIFLVGIMISESIRPSQELNDGIISFLGTIFYILAFMDIAEFIKGMFSKKKENK